MSDNMTVLRLVKNILMKCSQLNEWLYNSIDWKKIDDIIESAKESFSNSVEAVEEMKELCYNTLKEVPSQNLLFQFGVGCISLVILMKILSKIFSSLCSHDEIVDTDEDELVETILALGQEETSTLPVESSTEQPNLPSFAPQPSLSEKEGVAVVDEITTDTTNISAVSELVQPHNDQLEIDEIEETMIKRETKNMPEDSIDLNDLDKAFETLDQEVDKEPYIYSLSSFEEPSFSGIDLPVVGNLQKKLETPMNNFSIDLTGDDSEEQLNELAYQQMTEIFKKKDNYTLSFDVSESKMSIDLESETKKGYKESMSNGKIEDERNDLKRKRLHVDDDDDLMTKKVKHPENPTIILI